jgi:hypothetical protein
MSLLSEISGYLRGRWHNNMCDNRACCRSFDGVIVYPDTVSRDIIGGKFQHHIAEIRSTTSTSCLFLCFEIGCYVQNISAMICKFMSLSSFCRSSSRAVDFVRNDQFVD